MQIGVPTKCITGVQVDSGDDQITTTKSDSDFCFLSDSSFHWIYYLVGRIKTWI